MAATLTNGGFVLEREAHGARSCSEKLTVPPPTPRGRDILMKCDGFHGDASQCDGAAAGGRDKREMTAVAAADAWAGMKGRVRLLGLCIHESQALQLARGCLVHI